MCGIIGYVGNEQVAPILLDGLQRLEYRGYDSAGIAVLDEHDHINVAKTKGYVKKLYEMTDKGNAIKGTVGIGHTRWATHGEPSDRNSHPHLSASGRIAVVHNGIIENYHVLKDMLIDKGVIFRSDTDSEVVAQLLEYEFNGNILETITKVLNIIEGSYALGMVFADDPDRVYAVRKNNPLIIGVSKHGNLIASDIPAILKHTREVYYIKDNEISVLSKDNVEFYDINLKPIAKELSHIEWDVSAAEKGGYDHFMLKEIHEQPHVFSATVQPRIVNGEIVLDNVKLTAEYLKSIKRIYIVACGTAWHAGVVGKYIFEKLLNIPTEPVVASEFRYSTPILNKETLVLIISQSGETADTLAAMRLAKDKGARTLAIVNVVGSTIANEADDVIYTWAGPEIAVASTKAYTTQLAVIYLIALYYAKAIGAINYKDYCRLLEELENMPAIMQRTIDRKAKIEEVAANYLNAKSIFFIGRNMDYAAAMEASLKLKEISYIHSEAYAAGELKHGTISLIDEGTPVIAMASNHTLFDKMVSNIQEVRSRGAYVLGITDDSQARLVESVQNIILIPETDELFTPCALAPAFQLLAYYVAKGRGCDIDKPKNLAKSVTVE